MRYLYLLTSGLLTLSTILAGCGKESEPKKFTLRQGSYMLTTHPWLLAGKTVNDIDVLEECTQEDTLFFAIVTGNDAQGNPNPGDFFLLPGLVGCENETQDSDTLRQGTWNLSVVNNQTGLGIIMSVQTTSTQNDTLTSRIDQISGKFLTLSYTMQEDVVREEYISLPRK